MQAKQNINELHRLFQQMTEGVSDYSIVLLDERGTILTWNKGAEKIKGYTAGEIIGQHISIFYLPEDRQANLADKLLTEAKEKGTALFTGKRIRKNGTIFWGRVEVTAVRDTAGKIIGFTKLASELSHSTEIGSFWFDSDGVLHTQATSEPHTPEKIAELRGIIQAASGTRKMCCIADLRVAGLTATGNAYAQPNIAQTYKAIAFISGAIVDENTKAVMSLIPSGIPAKVFQTREEASRWIRQYL